MNVLFFFTPFAALRAHDWPISRSDDYHPIGRGADGGETVATSRGLSRGCKSSHKQQQQQQHWLLFFKEMFYETKTHTYRRNIKVSSNVGRQLGLLSYRRSQVCRLNASRCQQVYQLMRRCWEKAPDLRITFERLVEELTKMQLQFQTQNHL